MDTVQFNAMQAWLEMRRKGEQAAYNFARENFISHKTCEQISDMKHQFCELLSGIGFAPADLSMQSLKRQARSCGGDAVEQATGPQFNANAKNLRLLVGAVSCSLNF